MKKTLIFISITMVLVLCVGMVACNPTDDTTPDTDNRYPIIDELVLTETVDYTTVELNEEKYPALSDQGLFIITGYDKNDYSKVIEVPADDEDNIRNHFDPAKPTLIIIHGLQLGVGRDGAVYMTTENRAEEVTSSIYNKYVTGGEHPYFDNDLYREEHDLSKYWFDGCSVNREPYNVFYFHYERFADTIDGAGIGAVGAPTTVVDRIWSRDNGVQAMYFDDATGEYVYTEEDEAIGGYSVAEMFVGEYLRAFGYVDSLYPQYKEDDRIRTAAHSMGGVVTVASSILLKQVAENGAIDLNLTPSRHIQMDSYISMPFFKTSADTKIAWSQKPYVELLNGDGTVDEGNYSPTENYLEAIETLVLRYNVAIDYYVLTGLIVPFLGMADWNNETLQWDKNTYPYDMAFAANRVMAVTTIVIIKPYFAGLNNMVTTAGHNPVREWVLSSYLYDAPTVTKDGVTYVVPTAAMSNEDVIALRGTLFEMRHRDYDGNHLMPGDSDASSYRTETVRCDDDSFVKLK